ncbi:MAG TPA: NAD-dependent epimerase/dehydratase family protein [Arenibaculum sp.]|nr:NAD-dependent epimerase/dehydratase family protein [Arenibaculum sp.]
MATILVTGGAGYIGSHFCCRLAEAGHLPVVYDNLSGGSASAVRWGPLVVGNLLDRERLDQALDRHRPQAVVHCAVSRDVPCSRIYAEDVGGGLTLLEAVQARGIGHVVFTGCASVYGSPDGPVDELAATDPRGAAAVAKLIVERMLLDAGAAYGMRVASLRLPHVAGADDGAPGAGPMPEVHLLGRMLSTAVRGQHRASQAPGVESAGSERIVPTPAAADYLHVGDVADALVRALDHLLAGGSTAVLNLGTGRGVGVRDVLAAIESAMGAHLSPALAAGDGTACPVLVADRAARLIGWQPHRSGLDTIVASLLHAHRTRSVA